MIITRPHLRGFRCLVVSASNIETDVAMTVMFTSDAIMSISCLHLMPSCLVSECQRVANVFTGSSINSFSCCVDVQLKQLTG
jgi:hypothetical protein